ncbi:hypothetical protein TNCV_1282451 [Trichonephila clavipes]|uniref:Secreted protein n=1 Tax=Trichonephila clavipes TaxID=2585209 RepID=A0A8X6SUL5_TRICX|nr:hypothetical protein TNCV_1282451 [Trichonephila clavipes]
MINPAIVFASAQLILLYLGTAAVAFQRVQTCSIGERSGDLAGHAWVAQSALKYRPRICELSKCLEGPLKMIVCPRNCSPHCNGAVCRSTINAGSDRWPVRLRVRWSSAQTELNDTSPAIQSTLPMMWGQW